MLFLIRFSGYDHFEKRINAVKKAENDENLFKWCVLNKIMKNAIFSTLKLNAKTIGL